MQNLLNPRWLLLINTAPIILLSFIAFNQYHIIESLLTPESKQLWLRSAIMLMTLFTLNLAYTIYAIFSKAKLSIYYSIASLVIYISFLYIQGYYSNDLVTFDIPRWMLSGSILVYTGTFIMPTLVHSLFILVTKLTLNKDHVAWKNILLAIATPAAWYLFSQLILPFWQRVNSDFSDHFLVIIFILSTVTFLFFLTRAVYILFLKKGVKWSQYQYLVKVIVGLLFPIIGLLINNDGIYSSHGGVFGDFNSIWFYILAIINGIFIIIPTPINKRYRLLLYVGRCVTFTYTFYFFLIFLPYLPLSVIAILAVGTGFLMLTPLALFVIHIYELSIDYKFLIAHISKQKILMLSLSGLSILPIAITLNYLHDKHVLHETLDYIYSPDYSKTYEIDKKSLSKTLDTFTSHSRGFFIGDKTPYLSSYFSWIVLDNLTLSRAKVNKIERIFFNADPINVRNEIIRNDSVAISDINTHSQFDEKQNAWTSWIDLEITNSNNNGWRSEYATTISLPEGCWINDYYLYVGEEKKYGLLSEKKAAMWIFAQIKGVNRDPGLLYYLTGDRVSFRVFPFAANEVRKTGIKFIHKEPVNITIDDHTVTLGDNSRQYGQKSSDATQGVVYISSEEKKELLLVKRTPYYHFLVDASEGKKKRLSDYEKTVEKLLSKQLISSNGAKISLVNKYTRTYDFINDWKENFKESEFGGGFYLERAIKKALFNTHHEFDNKYPVFVVVSDNMNHSIIEKDFADFKLTFPENDLFYHLQDDQLICHSLIDHPKRPLEYDISPQMASEVLAWPRKGKPKAYLRNDNQPSIVLTQPNFALPEDQLKADNWNSALLMEGKWLSHVLNPQNSDKDWLNLVKYSFNSKVMSPVTSYIVVENEAQEAMLKQKQKETLAGKKAMDIDDSTQRMSEPALWVILLLIAIYWISRNRWIWGILRW